MDRGQTECFKPPEKFDSVFGFKLGYLLVGDTEQPSLQGKDTTLQEAITTANLAKNHYRRRRTETEFNKFYESCISFSEGKSGSAATIQESPWQAYMTELLLIGFNVPRIIIGCNTMKPTARLKRN